MSHDSTPHERTEALEHQLEEHGHVHHDDVDAAIVAREMAFESGDGPSPALGAKIVARAWTDPEFKARLVADGTRDAVGVHPDDRASGRDGEHA